MARGEGRWFARFRKDVVQVEKAPNPMNLKDLKVVIGNLVALTNDEYTKINLELRQDVLKRQLINDLITTVEKEDAEIKQMIATINTKRVILNDTLKKALEIDNIAKGMEHAAGRELLGAKQRAQQFAREVIKESFSNLKLGYAESREASELSKILDEESEVITKILEISKKQMIEDLKIKRDIGLPFKKGP
jgi:hypothetical protein